MKKTSSLFMLGVTMGMLWIVRPGADALRLEPYRQMLAVEVVAHGLQEPAGMALDPLSGLLYVAERGGGRISVVHEREVHPVLEQDFQVSDVLPHWMTSGPHGADMWTQSRFIRPTALTFDDAGRMYVAEAGPLGRLLRFEPMHDGLAFAHIVPCPWVDDAVGFTSVAVDDSGRVYTTMRRTDGAVLSMGRVLMREPDGFWWIVDYGPFAEFSNVVLTQDGSKLLFSEHRTADLTWYDTERQMLFGVMERVQGIRQVAMLKDGTTLATLHRADDTWSVVEIDPSVGRVWEWVGGLSEIGALYAHPEQSEIYISLAAEGRIMKLSRMETPLEEQDKLTELLRSFELENALPPKEWPEFFRHFVESLGVVRPVDGIKSTLSPVERSMSKAPMTIDEFTSAIPVVAAKVKAHLLSPPEMEPDPITEVSFVIFYPNRSMLTHQTVAPSVSLFRAEHQSGRTVRTRFLPNQQGQPFSEELDWENMPDVLVSFPSGYYAQRTGLSEEGLLRAYFLGMGLGSDYWIDIHRVQKNRSVMVVEKPNGSKVEYFLEPYEESVEAGGETVLVAGLTDVDKGWERLGNTPVHWNIVLDERPELNVRHMVKLEEMTWKAMHSRAQMAAPFRREVSQEEQSMRRSVVLRAASLWSENYF